jgi:hypothetical protein
VAVVALVEPEGRSPALHVPSGEKGRRPLGDSAHVPRIADEMREDLSPSDSRCVRGKMLPITRILGSNWMSALASNSGRLTRVTCFKSWHRLRLLTADFVPADRRGDAYWNI